MLVSFLILVTVGFLAVTEVLKGDSKKAHVVLLFYLLSKCVKFGTFPFFLQGFNSVNGQYGLCHN